jgi:hypothetical protein
MPKNKKLPDNQITVYQTPDGNINIEVLYANENIWLPQKRMAELFGCSADNISLHLKNIYAEKELDESATAEDFSVVLQQYIHKGFAIDSDRFKYGSRFSTRYFDDLLEEIRDTLLPKLMSGEVRVKLEEEEAGI